MKTLRAHLAAAFQICAIKGWDNWTYTHISARLPGSDTFLINPFGYLFQDITPDKLLEINLFSGDVASTNLQKKPNPTGIAIHSAIYKKRPDINAIFHLHTAHGTAVSAMECGLLPISQFALHFYDAIGTHAYDSLEVDAEKQTEKLVADLGIRNTMLLQNHGTVTAGPTLAEAFFNTHHLEEACKVQCLALGAKTPIIQPSPAVCKKAHADLMAFEVNRGDRDWQAALSLLSPAMRKDFGL